MPDASFELQAGPQQEFSSSTADVTIIGGGAYGGKSYAMCLEQLRYHKKPGFTGLMLRNTLANIKKGGGLLDTATKIFLPFGAKARQSPIDFQWVEYGSKIELAGCEQEKNKYDFQSAQYQRISFDELTQFSQTQFEYIRSRLRGGDGSYQLQVDASLNPDCNSWCKPYLQWWIGQDGYPKPERAGKHRWVVRTPDDQLINFARRDEALHYLHQVQDFVQQPYSLKFIPALAHHNKIGLKNDPGYIARLANLDRHERRALLEGNWNQAAKGDYFDRAWLHEWTSPIDDRDVRLWVRGWDTAYSEGKGDWTVGVLMALLKDGRVIIVDVQRFRLGPGQLERRICSIAKTDGHKVAQAIFQDPAAGKVVADVLMREIRKESPGSKVDIMPATKSKGEYFSIFSAAIDPEKFGKDDPRNKQIAYFRMGAWTTEYFSELEAWTGAEKPGQPNDQVDATSRAWVYIAQNGLYKASLDFWLDR